MFTQNQTTENFLTSFGVKWEYQTDVRYEELASDWNVVNHGRPESQPIDEELIEDYAQAMENQNLFPAPIVIETNTGYEILDGTQRLTAGELNGFSHFNAYVVNKRIKPETRQALRVCANNRTNGKRPKEAFTIKRIVDTLHEQQRRSVKECSVMAGVAEKKLQDEVDARKGKHLLKRLGVDAETKPASNVQFQRKFARDIAPVLDDQPRTQKEMRGAIVVMQKLKCNNGEGEMLLDRYAGIKTKKGTAKATQIKSVTEAIKQEPDFGRRLRGPAKRHPIENALAQLRGAITAAKDCRTGNADEEQSAVAIELLRELKNQYKRLVPRENWKHDADLF
jgi:hypothetical protein